MGGLHGRRKKITEINVTPLVDVVLVLLIVMMVAANFIVKGSIQVQLPKAATADDAPISTIGVTIDKQETLYLNGIQKSLLDLGTAVAEQYQKDKNLQAIIDADYRASHGAVVEVIDAIRTAGIVNFALNVEKKAHE